MRSMKRGVKKQKNYSFNHNTIKNKWKSEKRHRRIENAQIEAAWEKNKTARQNLDQMGLVYDLNKAIKIPKMKAPKEKVVKPPKEKVEKPAPSPAKEKVEKVPPKQEKVEKAPTKQEKVEKASSNPKEKVENNKSTKEKPEKVVEVKENNAVAANPKNDHVKNVPESKPTQVVQELEEEANQPQSKTLRLSQPEIRYCIYMMEKYAEDYEAMARDSKNTYQDTPAQIRRKILTFKSIPVQYNAYLRSKGNSSEAMDTSWT